MIVITGATGRLGGNVVEALLERTPVQSVGVSVRDPSMASALETRGVRVRGGDFSDPESLAHAFEGASQVLVVSVDSFGPDGVAQNIAAAEAAYAAGAQRVLYTSHQAARPDSPFAPGRDHASMESFLERHGGAWTALRNGYYATTSLGFHLGAAVKSGELVAPDDGPVAWTAPIDLGEAAAAILTGEPSFDGATPPLTASEAVDLEQVASILASAIGRPVRRVVVSDDEYVAHLGRQGMPEPYARLFVGSFEAARAGMFAPDPTLQDIIERPTTTVAQVIAEGVASGRIA